MESGNISQAAYVVFIEIIILSTGFVGFGLLIAQNYAMPSLSSSIAILFAVSGIAVLFVIILIHLGFHGHEVKHILWFKFRANALTFGVLQGVMHVVTSTLTVIFIVTIVYLNQNDEDLAIASLFSSRIHAYTKNISIQTYILVTGGITTTIAVLFIIEYVVLCKALGALKYCHMHLYAFIENFVILFLWMQFFREKVFIQLCPNENKCVPEDITVYEDKNFELLQETSMAIGGKLFLDMLTSKMYSNYKKKTNAVALSVYAFLRLTSVAVLIVFYFLFIEHEITTLKYMNWIAGALLTLCAILDIVNLILKKQKLVDNLHDNKIKTALQNKWAEPIKFGLQQNSRRKMLPFRRQYNVEKED